jgi:hypothetical protein
MPAMWQDIFVCRGTFRTREDLQTFGGGSRRHEENEQTETDIEIEDRFEATDN